MPLRQSRPGGNHLTGFFPSLKLGRTVAFESTLERDLVTLLEWHPQVQVYEEQPLSLEYRLEGRIRHYIPDFRVQFRGRWGLLECKPADQVSLAENQVKWQAAGVWCDARDLAFRMLTERDLRGPLLQRVQNLTYYARYHPPPHLTQNLIEYLSTAPASLHDLSVVFPLHPLAQLRSSVYHLLYFQQLSTSFERPLTLDSPLSSAKEVPDVGTPFPLW